MSRNFFIYFIGIICFIINETIEAQVVINEVMSKNNTTLADEDGDYSDWIELYNKGTETINLLGYTLSDNGNTWSFPNIELVENSFITVFASQKDKATTELHTNFSIKSEGESLLLYDSNENLLDQIESTFIEGDHSFGRITDGNETWTYFYTSTPNMPNNEGIEQAPITFSHTAGIYNENFLLSIESDDNTEIRYTTDGSIPTLNDEIYTTEITIDDRANDPNYYCLIRSTPTPYEPIGNVDKINVIRARTFKNGVASSVVYTKTYVVETDATQYSLPVLSLVTDPINFFDDNLGIYVTGATYDSLSQSGGNYWLKGKEWERPIHLELLEMTGEVTFSQTAGIRMHGGGSRKHRTKGFALYAREEYGKDEFEYPFFEDRDFTSYDRLVLRRGTGVNWSFFTDELTSSLVAETDIGRMAFKPVLLYLNGEFWGIYYLRERLGKHFLEQHYDVDKDSVDIIENNYLYSCCNEGTNNHFSALIDFIENNDMANDENYAYVQTQMDVDNFIEYLVLRLYMADNDWPYNNLRYWRPQTVEGKWQWLFFDNDFAFLHFSHRSFDNYMNSLQTNNPEWATLLGRKLLANEDFKAQFIEQYDYHLNYTFKTERVAQHIDALANVIEPYVQQYIDRYDLPLTKELWDAKVNNMKVDFASFRPCVMQDQLWTSLNTMIDIDSCIAYQAPIIPEDTTMTPEDTTITPEDTTMVFLPQPSLSTWDIGVQNQQLQLSCINCLSKDMHLKIYDLTGKTVLERTLSFDDKTITIPLYLPKAIYLCKIFTKKEMYTKKILVH